MKFLCFDFGQKRTGWAVSAPDESIVFPRGVLQKKTRDAFFADILMLLEAERPEALVVGLPLRTDGEESLITRQARNFAESLTRRCSLPIFLMVETYSSAEAESLLSASGQQVWKRDGRVDSLAAAKILESFLTLPLHRRPAPL